MGVTLRGGCYMLAGRDMTRMMLHGRMEVRGGGGYMRGEGCYTFRRLLHQEAKGWMLHMGGGEDVTVRGCGLP